MVGDDRAPRREGRWRWRLWAATGAALLLVAALLTALAPTTRESGNLLLARADAAAAVRALHVGDLVALQTTLARNRGNTDFAYFFASKVTPRRLGDGLATIADGGGKPGLKVKPGPNAEGFSLAELASGLAVAAPHVDDLTLTDLAGTLALATHGTGDRALPKSWADHFVKATTTPAALYGSDIHPAGAPGKQRADQDMANKQNLLLLLARGYWSASFLKAVTTAYWDFDHDNGRKAWPGITINDAKYAAAPNGSYLTDGMAALTAALTANPAASAWAFTEFQPGSAEIDGTDRTVGKLTHYLLFEHQFPQGPDGESVGMSAVLTALSSAIGATSGASGAQTSAFMRSSSANDGPLHDADTLQGWVRDMTERNECSWRPGSYLNCAKGLVKAVLQWIKRWGHVVLEVLSFVSIAALFAVLGPEVIGAAVVIGGSAAAVNAAWYAIDGDYTAAGLSFAAIAAGPVFKALATATKAGADAVKAATYADEVANAANSSSRAAKAADALARAEAGAATVVKGNERFSSEAEFEKAFAKRLKGSTTQDSFPDPNCTSVCRANWREGDVFHAKSGALFELKVGRLNKSYLPGEIARDKELRAIQSSGVRVVKYIFAADKNGRFFPDDEVRLWLKEAKIPYVICQGNVSACVKAAMAAA